MSLPDGQANGMRPGSGASPSPRGPAWPGGPALVRVPPTGPPLSAWSCVPRWVLSTWPWATATSSLDCSSWDWAVASLRDAGRGPRRNDAARAATPMACTALARAPPPRAGRGPDPGSRRDRRGQEVSGQPPGPRPGPGVASPAPLRTDARPGRPPGASPVPLGGGHQCPADDGDDVHSPADQHIRQEHIGFEHQLRQRPRPGPQLDRATVRDGRTAGEGRTTGPGRLRKTGRSPCPRPGRPRPWPRSFSTIEPRDSSGITQRALSYSGQEEARGDLHVQGRLHVVVSANDTASTPQVEPVPPLDVAKSARHPHRASRSTPARR